LLGLETGFNPELTGLENIYFNGTIQGYSKQEMDEKLDEILSFADIGDFIHQPIKIYSSGMKARLSFAVAININPDILIIDEVIAVGDALFLRKCYAKIQSFMDEGKTILFVTHAVNAVNQFCTRAILMDRGELVLEGPPKFVTMHYQRLAFASSDNVGEVRNEIIQFNKDEEKKKKYALDLEIREDKVCDEAIAKNDKIKDDAKLKAFYLPDFKPKTSVLTKNYDVDLYDIQIKTLDGRKVNVLITEENYIISYKTRFNVSVENARFGMGISTEKGIFLGGKLEKFDLKKKISKGDEFLAEWKFQCNLLAGNYFIGAGIRSLVDDNEIILCRINDAAVFKVRANYKSGYSGKVYFNQCSKITLLNK
jgi:lipopolysaccharide transport system ATP-binding protein